MEIVNNYFCNRQWFSDISSDRKYILKSFMVFSACLSIKNFTIDFILDYIWSRVVLARTIGKLFDRGVEYLIKTSIFINQTDK